MGQPGEILVRVTPPPGGMQEMSGAPLTERLADRVDELGESLGEVSNSLWRQLDASLTAPPASAWTLDELTLTFSLDLEVGAGVVVAKGKASAGFEVELTWRRRS